MESFVTRRHGRTYSLKPGYAKYMHETLLRSVENLTAIAFNQEAEQIFFTAF